MKLVTNFPNMDFLLYQNFFQIFMYNFDWHSFNDFTKKLDGFIMLFVLASAPNIGFFTML